MAEIRLCILAAVVGVLNSACLAVEERGVVNYFIMPQYQQALTERNSFLDAGGFVLQRGRPSYASPSHKASDGRSKATAGKPSYASPSHKATAGYNKDSAGKQKFRNETFPPYGDTSLSRDSDFYRNITMRTPEGRIVPSGRYYRIDGKTKTIELKKEINTTILSRRKKILIKLQKKEERSYAEQVELAAGREGLGERDVAILKKIAETESSWRQFDVRGKVLRGMENRRVVGLFQIHEDWHLETATAEGFDIYSPEGNIGYAAWLYKREGLRPWRTNEALMTYIRGRGWQ